MDHISEQILHVSALPPMPDSIIKIQKISSDPLSSLKDLAAVIHDDPMLTADILKLANSPIYALKEHINTLQQAISMFGISNIVGFAMAYAIEQALSVDLLPYDITPEDFLKVAQTQNALAFHWLEGLDSNNANILLTSSFLMEMGSLLIADYIMKKNMVEQFRIALQSDANLDEIEFNICGFNHKTISASMFESWDFDERIVEAIRQSAIINQSLETSSISARLAVISTAVNLKEQFTEHSIASAVELADKIGLDGNHFKKIVTLVRKSTEN